MKGPLLSKCGPMDLGNIPCGVQAYALSPIYCVCLPAKSCYYPVLHIPKFYFNPLLRWWYFTCSVFMPFDGDWDFSNIWWSFHHLVIMQSGAHCALQGWECDDDETVLMKYWADYGLIFELSYLSNWENSYGIVMARCIGAQTMLFVHNNKEPLSALMVGKLNEFKAIVYISVCHFTICPY